VLVPFDVFDSICPSHAMGLDVDAIIITTPLLPSSLMASEQGTVALAPSVIKVFSNLCMEGPWPLATDGRDEA
jgi:hypothetical protein